MTRLRERGAVDYTDLFSPAAVELSGRKKQGGKRKAREEEDAEEPKKKARRKKKEKHAEEEQSKEATVKAKRKEAKRRTQEEEGEEERVAEETAKRVSDAVAVVAKPATATTVSTENGSSELGDLRKKYDALREFRELETERLLREAKELARDEKRTYEKLVAKLKSEVATLAARAEQSEVAHQRKYEELEAEHAQRVESLKRERRDALETNEQLRKQVRELEAASKRQARQLPASTSDVDGSVDAGEVSVELTQAKKLLELYQLVTSTELRLIEAMDDGDDAETENYTDVACAVVDSITGKRFTFDLAVPHNDSEEVEYVPSDKPSSDFKMPSYLQEELSFKRSELTKFMRTVLDVVIRKKKSSESGRHNR